MKTSNLLKSIIVLTAICLVVSGALALTNSVTAPVIEAEKIARETAGRQALLPDAAQFLPLDEAVASVTAAHKGISDKGELVGYVFTAISKGFDSNITVMCAIDANGSVIRVRTIDVSGETKTLGGLTASQEYTDQYIGTNCRLDGVDAISGATITSEAYEDCVLQCYCAFEQVKEK